MAALIMRISWKSAASSKAGVRLIGKRRCAMRVRKPRMLTSEDAMEHDAAQRASTVVIAGLDPAIHHLS